MRRVAAVLSTAAVVLWSAGVFAQAPNFSGKWTLVPAEGMAGGGGGGGGRGGRGGFGGGGCGQECTITQDGGTLKIERTVGQNMVTMSYKLDGSESKNMMRGRGGDVEQVSKAVVQGSTIVITTAGQNGETKMVLSMDGGNLKIETTRPGRGGGDPVTSAQSYKKGL